MARAVFKMFFPAEPGNLILGREVCGALLELWGAETPLVDDVKTALTEACDNAIVHGYSGNAEGEVEIFASGVPGKSLELSVRDQGHGLMPNHGEEGLGMGLPLIAAVADQYQLSGGSGGGTEVRMCFGLDSAPARLSRIEIEDMNRGNHGGRTTLTTGVHSLIERFLVAAGSTADLDVDRISDVELCVGLALRDLAPGEPVTVSVEVLRDSPGMTFTLAPVPADSVALEALSRIAASAEIEGFDSSGRLSVRIIAG